MDSSPRGPDRKEVEAAFHALLEKLRSDPAASRSFLTGQPEDLRDELERMLADYRLLLETFTGSNSSLRRGRRLGEYELLAEIGRGGTGSVWEAEHRGLQRRVALKLLHPHLSLSPRALERFRREALAGARLSHPGIVTVYETGEDDGLGYLAMELVPGGFTLGDRIAAWREAPERGHDHWRELAQLFHSIAGALSYAHQLGVVHRDLKPGNILISEEGRPRIADFGLAKLRDELAMSRTGEMAGTPYYMSPEQAAGRSADAGPQTDVFSLGVTLYESLTLQRPFDAEKVPLVLEKILRDDPRDPRSIRTDVPRDLAAIALKAMEKKPAARYAQARDMAEDLRRYLADETVLAQPPGAVERGARWVRRHPVWSSTIALATVALVVFAWQFVAIKRERDLTLGALGLLGRTVQIVDQRAIDFGRENNIDELVLGVEKLMPQLKRRPADGARLLTLTGQLLSAARTDGALEYFDRAIHVLPDAAEIPELERANILFLAGMEQMRAYRLEDARTNLGKALNIAKKNWTSLDEGQHWNDPHVLDVAAQYMLCLRRGCRREEIDDLAKEYGNPESWMTARRSQLRAERGENDPSTIESGAALARWYFDERTIAGGNLRAKKIYDELVTATNARFGASDSRTLEMRLMYLAAWERSGVSQALLRGKIRPELIALHEEIRTKLGEKSWLTLAAQRRIVVCDIDVRDTAIAARLCEDLVHRMRVNDVLGPHHIDTYNARTDWGIALAYEDPARAVAMLTDLVLEMQHEPEIRPEHESTFIAQRALGLAYDPLEGYEQQVRIYWDAFQARGGWENLKDNETVVDLMSCLNSAVAIHCDEVAEDVLRKLPEKLSASLGATGVNPSTSWDYYHTIYLCMDAAQRDGRHDVLHSLLDIVDRCSPVDVNGRKITIPTFMLGRIAECRGNPLAAELFYRRAVEEECDPYAMELLGQLLAGQARIAEAEAVFKLANDTAIDGIFRIKIRREIKDLPR